MSSNTESKTVEDAWLEYRQFWNKYIDHLHEMGIKCYDDLKKKANEIIGERDPTRDQVKEALKLVVHPDDYMFLLKHIKKKNLELFTMTLLSKVRYKPAGKDKFRIRVDPTAEARPVIPEPFYGDPLDARIIAIYNNPGFNALLLDVHKIRVDKKWEERNTEQQTIDNEVERQRRNLLQLAFEEGDAIQNVIYPWTQSANPPRNASETWPNIEPKFASFDYHATKIYNTTEGETVYLPTIISKYLRRAYDKRIIFQLDFFPYQSEDGKADGVEDIFKANMGGDLLNSQKRQIDLVDALRRDSNMLRLVVFRSTDRMEIFNRSLEDGFAKSVFASGSGQSPYLTLGNLHPSKEMLFAYFSKDVDQ